jgi:hypothetical protein
VLSLDTRSERTPNQIVAPSTYKEAFSRLDALDPAACQHVLVMVGVPVFNNDVSGAEAVFKGLDTVELQKEINAKKKKARATNNKSVSSVCCELPGNEGKAESLVDILS